MGTLEVAIEEIRRASGAVKEPDATTKLESIAASLREMIDTREGERTDADEAFGDVDFEGSAPSEDNVAEVEEQLAGLAEETNDDARAHIEAALGRIASFREREAEGRSDGVSQTDR